MRASRCFSVTGVLVLVALASALPAVASAEERQPVPKAAPNVVRGALKATHFDISPPLREMMRTAKTVSEAASESPIFPDLAPPALTAEGPQDIDPVVQVTTGPAGMPGTIANFSGHPNGCNCSPPAPSLDVGRNHVFLTTNLQFSIYDKVGVLLAGPTANNAIWSGFGAPCQTNNGGYPIVLYDQLADRWLISQTSSFTAPYGLCIAVSTTGDPLGSWYRWSFSTGSDFPDGIKWAMWPDAYYAGATLFVNAMTYSGFSALAFERADLLAGVASPSVVSFTVGTGANQVQVGNGLLPADMDGTLPPPPGSAGVFLGTMDNGGPYGAIQDALTVWRFHADFAIPANSTFTLDATLPTNAFDSIFPCTSFRNCIPQASTAAKLDFNANRQQFLNRVSYRNFGTHQSIVANHSVDVLPGIGGIRWYELRDPHGTPLIYQQGTYAPGLSDGIHRWMAGIAMDNNGNMGLGYSVSNATIFPGIRYTGRLVSDPLGTMPQGEGTIVNGTGAQTGSNRWGDYTTMAIDPGDDCTFWYVNEYIPTTSSNGWRTRIASFKFPTCVATVGVDGGAISELRTSLAILGPSRGSAAMRFSLSGGVERHVRLDVFDVSGRRLRNLVNAILPPGTHDIAWDGLDESGHAVGAGVYFARMRAGHESDSGTILLLR